MVMEASACPSWSAITPTGTPASDNRVATVLRNVWGSPRLSPRSLGRRGPACPGCCHPVGRCPAHTSAAVRQHVLLRETEGEHGDCFGLAVETARSWRLSSPQLPSQDSAGCDNDGRSPQARLAADVRAEIQFDDVTRRQHPATQSLRRSGRSRGHAPWHLAAALGSPC